MKKFVFVFFAVFLPGMFASAQSFDEMKQLADSNYAKKNYKEALVLYERLAVETHDLNLLNQAAVCYSRVTGKDKCKYFKKMQKKGFVYKEEDLFFYGCDKNFRTVNVRNKGENKH